MTRVAITGHRGLPAATEHLIDTAIRAELARYADAELVGLSCIADGADALFAQAVLDLGGTLAVIVPAAAYRDGLPAQHHATYDSLLAHATTVIRLNYSDSTSEAHMHASRQMLDETDVLFAVWDGEPARGYGGTADVVVAAEQLHLPLRVIWPQGATRGEL